jgi:hypothetical protein
MVIDERYNSARNVILNKFKDSEIMCAMFIPNGFLFSIKPKRTSDYVLDGFFTVDYSGSVKEYSPVMNPDEFKTAMKNIIFSKRA